MLQELLLLTAQSGPEPVLAGALRLLIERFEVRVGYIAIGPGLRTRSPRWWSALGTDTRGIARIRNLISEGTLGESLVNDGVVCSTVNQNGDWQAVLTGALCRPDGTPVGVVYLSGPEADAFTTGDIRRFDQFLGHLGPLAASAADVRRYEGSDETTEVRQRLKCEQLVGRSAALARVLDQVAAVADLPVTVLVEGPSGSGKTEVARVVHDNSGCSGPFVSVNCSHLTEGRALVDLFGARAGAYTGLTRDRDGLVCSAESGTLFLDEVDSLPSEVQAQLLTFLQDREYRRVGETRVRKANSVRVIAATNRGPEDCVADGSLREDLFYRMAQFRIRVPSLDERPSDVPLLVHALVARAAEAMSIHALPLSADAQAWIESKQWPGNVRDLQNVLRSGLIWARAERSPVIEVHHLNRDTAVAEAPAPERLTLKEASRRFKERYVQAVVRECGGNRSEAARRLGIHRSSLYTLLGDQIS